MTNRMTSLDLFEQFDGLNDLYIAEAEIPETHRVAKMLPKPRRENGFSRFVNSGWGVAIVCALVAVSVMGGIIWAGFNAENVTPVGAQPTEDLTFEQETMEDIDPPAAEIAAKAPKFGWEKSVKSVQTTAFYSLLTYNMLEMGEYHVTEISLATREDDTRTLMFRLINRETYEVIARYSWDVTEGKWGVMDYGGFFAVYCATEKGEQTLMNVDVFWWRPELDPHSYEYMGRHIPTVEESTTYIWKSPNAKDTAEWSRFIREWFTDWPTTYLCMDEALGDLAFYTEDNRYTDGWARMRLLWQDLYILDGEEATRGLEIVTEKVGPEDIVTEWSGNETETERAMEMYEAAIKGEICVFDERLGEVKLEDCRFPSHNLRLGECEILNKAILDMDGDGTNEYVIQSETKDHIVLHYYNGKVYSYCFDRSHFYNLNIDGSFYWSDSYESENWSHGLNQITFNGSSLSIKEIYRIKHISPLDFYENLEFYVDGKQFTSREFSDYYGSNHKTGATFSPLDISCEYPISSEKAYELASNHWGFESGMSEGAAGTRIVNRIVILEKPNNDTLSYRICWQMEGYRNHVPDSPYSLPPKSVTPYKELYVDAITGECREYIETEPETIERETIEPETTEPETEPEITTEMLMPPTEPASDDLEFYITQNVEDVDFSDHAEIYGWFGAREFLGKGYETVPVEGSTPTHPEHYVSYVIGAYPDEADGGQYVTQITITDPQVTYYGLTVHSTAEVFRETLERLGYTVKISVKSNGETFSAEKGNLRVSLNKWENEQPKLHVVAEVTNREGIIY